MDKETVRNNLSFHLRSICGGVPTLKDSAQQNFEVVGGLNPVQIETEDDRVLNMLKKHKYVIFKLIPIGILFPASIQNDKRQVFITCRELNDVKKSLINGKIYGLLGIIDLKKPNNWEEIKGQSIWINADLVEQK